MSGINLSRTGQRIDSKSMPLVGASFTVSVGLLVFVFVLYFGLMAFNGFLEARMTSQRQAISDAQSKMNSPEAVSVVDFTRRSEEVDKHIQGVVLPTNSLDKLEKAVLPETALSNYEWTNGNDIKLQFTTNSIRMAAQQLLAFKSDFVVVSADKVSVDPATGLFLVEAVLHDKSSSSK